MYLLTWYNNTHIFLNVQPQLTLLYIVRLNPTKEPVTMNLTLLFFPFFFGSMMDVILLFFLSLFGNHLCTKRGAYNRDELLINKSGFWVC